MIFLAIICININIYAKYIFDATYTIANIDIDRNPPKIELVSLENTNTGYEKYANQTHTITAKIKVITIILYTATILFTALILHFFYIFYFI